MSTGETTSTPRFTSPSNTTTKKYPSTPKSPLVNNTNSTNANNTNTTNRNSLARQRLLSSKISAPRPMNLPSLRREHAVGTEVPASSPSTSHGWGSSTSSSPSNSFTQESEHIKPPSPEQQSVTPPMESHESTEQKVVDPVSTTATTRAWNVPTKNTTQPIIQPSTDFPTAAEAAAGKKKPHIYDDKEYLKYASHDPNHTSWDEMVSEDLDDFSVDVVEFDDGTKVQIDGTEELVNPSDRFTEDYDRSYPPKSQSVDHTHSSYKSTYRRSEDHGYNNSRYNNSVHGYDTRRHSNTTSTPATTENRWNNRRESADSNHSNNNRRSSYDKKSTTTATSYHPSSLLQRPRRLSEQSMKSDHSREDTFHFEQHTNPLQIIPEPPVEEITAAQKQVMLTAAERAKKRRDEEEAEFEAARVRARQKADALAEKARLDASTKEIKKIEKRPIQQQKRDSISSSTTKSSSVQHSTTSSSLPDTSTPWNLVAAKKEIMIEKRPVDTIVKTDAPLIDQPKNKSTTTEKQQKDIVEVLEYNDMEESGQISSQVSKNKGQYRGWTRNDEEHGGRGERSTRGRGADRGARGARINGGNHSRRQSENNTWRQAVEPEKETTIVTEILKHETKPSKKTRLINLLKESSSPIFPEAIQKLVGKKPANISFMIDVDESDKDITMMDIVEDDVVVPESEPVEEASVPEVVEKASVPEVVEKASVPEVVEEASVPEVVEEAGLSKAVEEASVPEATEVPEAIDEASATSGSTTSTPPRTQFEQNKHTKLDSSSSPRRLNMNPNFPVLVYQYPMSDTLRSKGLHQQQRPMGVYLMPPQQYMTSNQYMIPYPQAGTGIQPIYYPTVSWQTQYNRPQYDQQRRSYNKPITNNNSTGTSHMSEWEAIANSSVYQSQRFAHSFPNSTRGTSYRNKRGGWSNNHRGRGNFANSSSKRYPDVNNAAQQQQHTDL